MSAKSAERRTVLHSWCVQADWDAPTIVGGQGARFWDEHGRMLLDMSSLSECMNLGHQHPVLVKAIQDQAASLCFTTAAWGAAPRARLAERLLEKSGFEGGRVFFTLGGADAVEHAVKFARQASGDPLGLVDRPRSQLPRRQLRGDGLQRRHPHGVAGRFRAVRRGPRAASVRLPLPVRIRVGSRVRNEGRGARGKDH